MTEQIFELTKIFFQRLTDTEEGKELLSNYDHAIGFEVVGKNQVMDITKRYYHPRYTGPYLIGEERFIVEVISGKPAFRDGEDVPIPPSTSEEADRYTKILAEKQTYLDIYSGKVAPVDALIPEAVTPCKMNIIPFQSAPKYVIWINDIFRMIARSNRKIMNSLD